MLLTVPGEVLHFLEDLRQVCAAFSRALRRSVFQPYSQLRECESYCRQRAWNLDVSAPKEASET